MNTTHSDTTWFKESLADQLLANKLQNIKLIITDIDGSLTDGYMDYTTTEELSRRFSILDGMAIAHSQKVGLPIAFLSGKKHQSGALRARKLGIPEDLYFEGREDKKNVIEELVKRLSLNLNNIMLFGDDYFDTVVKTQFPTLVFAAPLNAPFYLHNLADIVLPKQSNNHAFRLLLDLILYLQKKHFAQELIDTALTL